MIAPGLSSADISWIAGRIDKHRRDAVAKIDVRRVVARRRGIRQRYLAAIQMAAEAAASSAMRYGKDDCLMFIANIDVAATGRDSGAPYRGRYRSKSGARRVMGRGGVVGVLAKAAKRLGWTRVEPRKAKIAARGIVMTPEGPAGVVFDGVFWIGRDLQGVSAHRAVIAGKPFVLRAWDV